MDQDRGGIMGKNKSKTMVQLAVSIAATWGWGFSLLNGLTIVRGRGIVPFIIWGTCNALALLIFGVFVQKYPLTLQTADSKGVLIFTTLVRVFSVWIQMSAIYETIVNVGYPEWAGQTVAYSLGAIYIIAMFFRGIWGSVRDDNLGWILLQVSIFSVILVGAKNNSFLATEVKTGVDQIGWALWSGLLLIGGPFVDLSLNQRAKIGMRDGKMKSFNIAFILFFVYQAFVLFLGLFKFNSIMDHMLIVAVYALAISTLNSDAVSLQHIKGRKFGLILGLTAVALWQFVKFIGFFNLWQIIANIRIFFAAYIVIKTLKENKKKEKMELKGKFEWEK